jgi:hypothetical protein
MRLQDQLDPLDRPAVEALAGPLLPLIHRLHRQHARLYALGGLASVALACGCASLAAAWTRASALQAALCALGGLLLGLALLRALARRQAERLRQETLRACQDHPGGLDALRLAARRVGPRASFFEALWASWPPPDEQKARPTS